MRLGPPLLLYAAAASLACGTGEDRHYREAGDADVDTDVDADTDTDTDTDTDADTEDPGPLTWTDPETGIIWERDPLYGMMAWIWSGAFCEELELGGHDDWRLPTLHELRSLIRGCPDSELGGRCSASDDCLSAACLDEPCGGCAGRGGPGPEGCYWPAELPGSCARGNWATWAVDDIEAEAWFVDFRTGAVGRMKKDTEGCSYVINNFTRCVRDPGA